MLREYISTLIASSIAVTHAFTPHLPCPVNWHFRGANEQRSTVHFSGTNMPTVISMKKPMLYFLQNKQGKKNGTSQWEKTLWFLKSSLDISLTNEKLSIELSFVNIHRVNQTNRCMIIYCTFRLFLLHGNGWILSAVFCRFILKGCCYALRIPVDHSAKIVQVRQFHVSSHKITNWQTMSTLRFYIHWAKPNVQLKEDKSRLNIVSYTMCPYGSERSAFCFSARSKIKLEIQ